MNIAAPPELRLDSGLTLVRHNSYEQSLVRRKTKEEIAANMSAIRSIGGKTENALRRALHALGLRYRKNLKCVLGVPDIAFPAKQVAVFIDGDYWHGRILKEHGPDYLTKRFTEEQVSYWVPKLTRNVARDEYVNSILREQGWLVLRYWESDVKNMIEVTATEIAIHVRARRP